MPRKRGHPDWVSSSFYLPGELNIKVDKALLDLKSQGVEQDRSDTIAFLLLQWSEHPYAVPKHSSLEGD